MSAICTASTGNLGTFCTAGNTTGVMTGIILTTKDFKFTSFTDFATEQKWLDGVKAKTVFPLQGIVEFDDNTEEPVYYTSPLGNEIFLRDGKYKFRFRFNLNKEQSKELFKFNGASLRAFFVDSAGNIWGYSDDDTNVQGFTIATFKPENSKVTTADAPGWTSLMVNLANPNEMNKYFVALAPDFQASDLTALANVIVTVVTSSATSIKVSVGEKVGQNSDGTDKLIPIIGLVAADFTFLKTSDGTAQTPTGVVDNGDGTYTAAFTAAVTGTVNLKAPSDLTTTDLIESTGAASFTIS